MATGIDYPTFYDRFEDLRRGLRRFRWFESMTVTAIWFLVCLTVFALLDYRVEMAWSVRVCAFALVSITGLWIAIWLLVGSLRRMSRSSIAAAIERRFPELGQKVRTSIEYQGLSDLELRSRGLAPGLVRALETEAVLSTLPLPLESMVPKRRTLVLMGTVASIIVILGTTCIWHGEWQTAIRRVLLADESFSHLFVDTKDSAVDYGTDVSLFAALGGRPRENVILRIRPLSRKGGIWEEKIFSIKEAEQSTTGEWWFEAIIPAVTESFDFQWIAGSDRTRKYQVIVRQPLRIVSTTIEITPPEYTGLPSTQTDDPGRVVVLEGSLVKAHVRLDGSPTDAHFILRPVKITDDGNQAPESIEAVPDENGFAFETKVSHDLNWSLEGTSPEGLALAPNSFRIRVRRDQAPTVVFEEPYDALEVHPLAEIVMPIKARDDFGLTRAGIVFQINNDEEHTLIAANFKGTDNEDDATEQSTVQTSATIERTLPLEHFKLIEKDAITYYAFAEDNRPDNPQRTETELRFIDIRPFKVEIKQRPEQEDGEPNDEGGVRRASFNELIARQRTALNRTKTMQRAAKPDLTGLDRLMDFENEIAELTRELGDYLQGLAIQFENADVLDQAELMFQAERKMLDSVDSMSVGKFDIAMLQEKDAVRFLIETRERLAQTLDMADSGSLREALNRYFRLQQMKLRRKSKKRENEDRIKSLLSQLSQLTVQQLSLAEQLEAKAVKGTRDQADSNDQQEIAKVSADLRKEFNQMAEATELSKQRMAEANEAADAALVALAGEDAVLAAKAARDAARKFDHLLTLAQGLLAAELPDQLGVSRDLADELSRLEENLSRSFGAARSAQPNEQIETGSDEARLKSKRNTISAEAERLAIDGESLVDILNSTTKSIIPSDQKVIPKITELLGNGGLQSAIERIQRHPAGIRDGKLIEEQQAATEIAEALIEAARKLDALKRELENPELAQLMKAEQAARDLEGELDDVETKRQASEWFEQAGKFLDELKQNGTDTDSDEALKEELKAGGWDEATNRLRGEFKNFEGDRYRKPLRKIATEIRERVQQLLLNETLPSETEKPPAQFEDFVIKYQRVLSAGTKPPDMIRSKVKDRSKD